MAGNSGFKSREPVVEERTQRVICGNCGAEGPGEGETLEDRIADALAKMQHQPDCPQKSQE